MSGTFEELTKPRPSVSVAENGLCAAEALCMWESTGSPCTVSPEDYCLFLQYAQGKSQRDWWTREIGLWNKELIYFPEEFLKFLGPLPFIELFGRAPISRIVRYFYDNHYALWEFKLDCLMVSKTHDWSMSYFERNDRDSAVKNAWRIVRVKWIDPAIYRLNQRFLPASRDTSA